MASRTLLLRPRWRLPGSAATLAEPEGRRPLKPLPTSTASGPPSTAAASPSRAQSLRDWEEAAGLQ